MANQSLYLLPSNCVPNHRCIVIRVCKYLFIIHTENSPSNFKNKYICKLDNYSINFTPTRMPNQNQKLISVICVPNNRSTIE